MTSADEARAALARVCGLAEGDLRVLWDSLQGLPAGEVRDALMEALPLIGQQYGDAAAALAADWYEAVREAAGVAGSFFPVLAEQPDASRWESLTRWGLTSLFTADPRPADALTLVSGGLQRSVANQHRQTVVESSIADPAAKGWMRVARSGGCGFCRMLASRGAVYTDRSVEFKSHDHCGCSAAPSFDQGARRVIGVPYVASKRASTEADRARVRDYVKSMDS